MNDLYFLTEAAQDTLKQATDNLAKGNAVEAILDLGQLRHILNTMELEQENTAEKEHNGQCRN